MMSSVAPDAVFAPLPDGAPLAVGRDSVQAFDRRVLSPAHDLAGGGRGSH